MKMSIGEQLTYSTIRIICNLDGGLISTGTGFFFNFCENEEKCVPAIVTNKHVVKGAKAGLFRFSVYDKNENRAQGEKLDVNIENFEQKWIKHPDENVDLCALPIASIINTAVKNGKRPFYVSLTKDIIPSKEQLKELEPIEDVVMIGYPDGIWDEKNNLPIARKGITATHPGIEFNGKSEFMIDIACFNGSSGSPAFIYNRGAYPGKNGVDVGNRILFIGVVYAVAQHKVAGRIEFCPMPTVNVNNIQPMPITDIPNNLALAIMAEELLAFETIFSNMEGEKQ